MSTEILYFYPKIWNCWIDWKEGFGGSSTWHELIVCLRYNGSKLATLITKWWIWATEVLSFLACIENTQILRSWVKKPLCVLFASLYCLKIPGQAFSGVKCHVKNRGALEWRVALWHNRVPVLAQTYKIVDVSVLVLSFCDKSKQLSSPGPSPSPSPKCGPRAANKIAT